MGGMNSVIDPRAVPVRPQREAGVRRFQSVLDGAEALLAEQGLSGFSIPVLAERLGYTRRSIYKFFPTPYAILNELTRIYLERLAGALAARAMELSDTSWEIVIREMVKVAADFHNRHVASRMLILGGAVTDESFRATEYAIQKLGAMTAWLMRERGIALPSQPAVAALAVDIGTTVLRVSNLFHGRVTQDYVDEAAYAMIAYLSGYAEPTA